MFIINLLILFIAFFSNNLYSYPSEWEQGEGCDLHTDLFERLELADKSTGSEELDNVLVDLAEHKGLHCVGLPFNDVGVDLHSFFAKHNLPKIFVYQAEKLARNSSENPHISLIDLWIYAYQYDLQEGIEYLSQVTSAPNMAVAAIAARFGDVENFSRFFNEAERPTAEGERELNFLTLVMAGGNDQLIDFVLTTWTVSDILIYQSAVLGGNWDRFQRYPELHEAMVRPMLQDYPNHKFLVGQNPDTLLFPSLNAAPHPEIVKTLLEHAGDVEDWQVPFVRYLLSMGKADLTRMVLEQMDDTEFLILGQSNINGPWSDLASDEEEFADQFLTVALNPEVMADPVIRSHLDGVINPGCMDTFPDHGAPFDWADVVQEMEDSRRNLANYPWKLSLNPSIPLWLDDGMTTEDMQEFYQYIVGWTEQQKVPYLGICGGAQHLVLYAGGKLQAIKGYEDNQVRIEIVPYTVGHYLTLDKEEQEQFCQLDWSDAPILENAQVWHYFAAVPQQALPGIEWSGHSEEGVPQLYTHGLFMIGVQFHPEDSYQSGDVENGDGHLHLLTNFLELTALYQNLREEVEAAGGTRKDLIQRLADYEQQVLERIQCQKERSPLERNEAVIEAS